MLRSVVPQQLLNKNAPILFSSGDFQMNYNPDGVEDNNYSAFYLFEQACFEMGEISYSSRVYKSGNTGPLYKNFLYSRMLWGELLCLVVLNN